MSETKKPTKAPGNDNPNKDLKLADIDYKKMKGDTSESKKMFEDYQKIESELLLNEKYDFELWKATSNVKYKLDEDTGEKAEYVGGINLNSAEPIQVTRITAANAFEINKNVSHLKTNEHTATSKYCLLKKPE